MKKKTRKFDPNKPFAKWTLPEPEQCDQPTQPDLANHILNLAKKTYMSLSRTHAFPTPTSFLNHYQTLLHDYTSKLPVLCDDILSPDEIAALDVIDARALQDNQWPNSLLQQYFPYAHSLEHPVYAFVPCFTKGLFIMPTMENMLPCCVVFELLNIDESKETLRIKLNAYTDQTSGYEPSVGCVVNINAIICTYDIPSPYLPPIITLESEGLIDYPELYTRIQPKILNWSRLDCQIWEKTVLQNAVDQMARYKSCDSSPFETLSRRFTDGILAVNACLSSKRPVIIKDTAPSSTDTQPVPKTTQPSPQPIPTRRVRSVGVVKFVSAAPPKPGAKAARNYKTPSWTARGHVRHYKNGKQVYIKPTVKHRRKKLTDQAPVPSTIIIRDNRPGPEPENPDA